MATLKIKLDWIPVISRIEIEEFSKTGSIRPYVPKDPRHKLIHYLRHNDKVGYKGGWGPELIFFDPITELGSVWATHHRAIEIRDWIRDNLFS